MNGTDSKIISALRRSSDGMTITELAAAISRSRHTTARCLDRMLAERKVKMRRVGTAKVFKVK